MMTSFAFILGVVPLMVSAGAGAEMRQTLGTAVFSGMLGVTLFGIFLTPVFYYVIQWVSDWPQPAATRGRPRERGKRPARLWSVRERPPPQGRHSSRLRRPMETATRRVASPRIRMRTCSPRKRRPETETPGIRGPSSRAARLDCFTRHDEMPAGLRLRNSPWWLASEVQ